MIGCSWCMDFGYYAAHSKGLRAGQAARDARAGASPTSSPTLERQVLEYAEAMTATPPRSPTR